MKRSKPAGSIRGRRLLLIGPLAVTLLYATAAVSFAEIAYDSVPEKVLALYPTHGPSLSAAAALAIGSDRSEKKERTTELAQAAVRQSPVAPAALRSLALVSEMRGDRARAVDLLSAALRLDRRNLAVTLLLIEEHIRRGDLPGTLRLYDIGLRASRQAPSVLIPNLVEAARDPAFLAPLAGTLAAGPDWGDEFSKALLASDIPAENKVRLAGMLRGKRWFDAPFQNELVSSLVRGGRFELAARVVGRTRAYDARLSDAFDLGTGTDAFRWKLANSYYVDTAFQRGKSGQSLAIRMSSEFRDRPARILLLLPSGSYTLRSRLGSLTPPQAGARWVLECAQAGGSGIASLDLQAGASTTTFSVSQACEAQWLSLELSDNASSAKDIETEIETLSITPADAV